MVGPPEYMCRTLLSDRGGILHRASATTGPMMLQVAALLLLAPGRCTSKFVGEGGSGGVMPLSHAALLQLLL